MACSLIPRNRPSSSGPVNETGKEVRNYGSTSRLLLDGWRLSERDKSR